jgi:hypothetical protein
MDKKQRNEAIRLIFEVKCKKYATENMTEELRKILLEESIAEAWFSEYTMGVRNGMA